MNGLDVAIIVIVFLIVAGILFAFKAWRQRRSTQYLIPLTWSNIYHVASDRGIQGNLRDLRRPEALELPDKIKEKSC